jgi:RNA polymerase primary sigma factor
MARLEQEYQRACHRLMLPNLRLVLSVVNRCSPSRDEVPDFVQEGVLGLMRAVEKFDRTRGCKFSTYAYWWVRTAVLQAKLRHRSPGHVSQRLAEKLRKVRLANVLLWQTKCRRPTLRQTARAAGMSEGSVEGLQRIRQSVFSLNHPQSQDDPRELGEIVPDYRQEDPSGLLDRDLLKQRIGALLQELDYRERQVICLRFGLEGGQPLSLRDTGRITRLSGERIRQIEENTMRKLRQPGRVARLVEFLEEPAPVLLAAAAELRTCAYDALLEQDRARETRLRLRKQFAREELPCQTKEHSPDAA